MLHHECHTNEAGVKSETWRERPGGALRREDGPAAAYHRPDGGRVECWHHRGELYRVDGPAYIETYPDGRRTEQHFRHGKLYRANGFACIVVYADGTRVETSYFRDGRPAPRPTDA